MNEDVTPTPTQEVKTDEKNVVKGSNLGFIIGILVVVAIGMLLYKSDFIQSRIGKKSEEVADIKVDTNAFEIFEEPEITLLGEEIEMMDESDENQVYVEEVEEIEEMEDSKEEVKTHEPIDTAIGDINPALLSLMLILGAGVVLTLSKRLV